ncbi:MAG TPA: polyprenyl synthetase family protein [Nitrospinaceae bacterium]|nr:polyprenyl synthetase family protein [Nitrospinaceae bacterium]
MSAAQYLSQGKEYIDAAICGYLPNENTFPASIHKSMLYSILAGGKRLRPVLLIAAAEAVGGNRQDILPFAVATEYIHTYTLIHDDLPALDDDDLRRGKPTNHKVFGEAIAVLAGDALLTQAFYLMTDSSLMSSIPPEKILQAAHDMTDAIGTSGMIGGQVVDIESEGKPISSETLEYIHVHKTGCLIKACIRAGAILSQSKLDQLEALSNYGGQIGLAFQIVDDILDITADQSQLGKDIGSDVDKKKATYPALYGLDKSKKKADELVEEGIACLEIFGEKADPLRDIGLFFTQRTF